MSLTTNKIGDFEFVSLRGEVIPPMATKVIDDRPGVDGSEFVLTGTKGRPFSVVSQVDEASYQAAKTLLGLYRALIDSEPVEIVQGGVSSESHGYRVAVLNVEPLRIMPIRNAVGNKLNPPSQGWIECRWDLVAVPLEE